MNRFAMALLLAAAAVPAQVVQLERHVFERMQFGNIPVELCLHAPDRVTAEAAADAAFARIAELAAMMSDYAFEPPSALNRIAAAAPAPVPVPSELFGALRRAVELHAITDGAFDVTSKPFVQLWRTSRRIGELPPPARLRRAGRLVDIGALALDAEASTAALRKPGMWLDLGGIAKGLIGDEVVELLRERGIASCRYHAGGDMVFGDPPPGKAGWRVTVPDLLVDGRPFSFLTSNAAVSVSGDVYRFFEIDGVRYAHVIDPRTGLGVTDRRVACVRGPRGVDTDALATAGLVLADEAWRAALRRVPGCRGEVAQRPTPAR